MYRDALTGDVFQDTLIRRRGSSRIVLRLQTVDGDYNIQVMQYRPVCRKRAERAGDDLNVNAFSEQQRDQNLQFPVSHQRIASDD